MASLKTNARAAAARARAEAAARKSDSSPKTKAASAPPAQAHQASSYSGDEAAARRDALNKLGGGGASAAPPGTPTYRATDVQRNPTAFAAGTLAPASAPPPDDGSYDKVEQIRAERARQQALDAATQGLPPDQARQVKDAADAVMKSQQGISDPGRRARATAEAVAAQSEKFKGNPAAARAFVQAVSPWLQSVGSDLSNAITTPLHGSADKDTGPTVQALARACDNLGDGASLALGKAAAAGLPDTQDLNHLDDRLKDVAGGSQGGQRLLFALSEGFAAQGKTASAGDLADEQRQVAMTTMQPGDVAQPVDPKDPDALGKAQMKLAYAKAMPGEGGNPDTERYATALQSQLQAFKDDPAARKALAQSQVANIEALARKGAFAPGAMHAALMGAEAAGPDELKKVAEQYAARIGPGRESLQQIAESTSPRQAAALAFAFDKAGNATQAQAFAARASQMLGGAADKAKEANDTLEKAQSKLDQELAKVGPALTPTQRADYEKRFWAEPDNAKAVRESKETNAALQGAVSGDLDTLKRLAAINPAAAKATAKAMSELARDPAQASYVEATTQALVKDPAFKDAQEDLGKANVTASQLKAEAMIASGDTEGALEKLKATGEFLEHTQWATKEMQEFVKEGLPALKGFTSAVADAVKTKDLSKISGFFADQKRVAELESASEKGGGLGKAFGAMVKGVGVASYLMEASQAPEEKDRLLAAIKGVNGTADLVADGFQALGKATHDASSQLLKNTGADFAAFGEKMAKITGAVGFGLSLFSDAQTIAEAVKDPNLKTVGAAVGDTLSAVGGGIALIPGGEVVGGAIAFVGAGVSFVTGLIQDRRDEDARKGDTENLLKQVLAGTPGLTPQEVDAAARRLAGSSASWTEIADAAKLDPRQVVQLAARQPAFDEKFALTRDMTQVAKHSGLQGDAFVKWVSQLSPRAVNMLTNGVVEERTNGIERSARETASRKAMQAHENQGQDFGTVRAQVYQQECDRQMREMLKDYGLIP